MATPDEKQAVLDRLVTEGVVMLHLDARRPGVKVPTHLKNEMQLRLNFNHLRGKRDLAINGWGVRESLSFGGIWSQVAVPWSAIYALSAEGKEPLVFPEDLPEEMVEAALARLQREGASAEEAPSSRPARSVRPRPAAVAEAPPPAPAAPSVVTAVPSLVPAPEPLAAAEESPRVESAEPTPARRGHLRLVK